VKKGLLSILVISYLFLSFTGIPLWDPDFWWHMKTGEYIITQKTLPQNDPFSGSSHGRNRLREEVILKSYWLAQVVFYTAWDSFGIKGIILLRSIILASTLLIIYINLKQDTNPLLLSVSLFLTGKVLLYFTGERPQMFAFPIVCMLTSLIEGYRKKRRRWFYFLPLLMLLWANLHGSYILGDALLLILIIVELIKYSSGKSEFNKKEISRFLLINILAMGFSLINPVSYKTFLLYQSLHSEIISKGAIEHMPLIKIALIYKRYFIYFWLISLFILICILLERQRGFNAWHLITIATFILSLWGARYMVFFAIIAPVLLKGSNPRLFNNKKVSSLLYLILICIILVETAKGKPFNFSVIDTYPHRAVESIKWYNPRANIFNYLDWGGYLIANLPTGKVFIDGRLLDEDRYASYSLIIEGVEVGERKEWRGLLDANSIDTVLLPLIDPNTGQPIRLIQLLLKDESWSVIYNDDLAIVFTKRASSSIR